MKEIKMIYLRGQRDKLFRNEIIVHPLHAVKILFLKSLYFPKDLILNSASWKWFNSTLHSLNHWGS